MLERLRTHFLKLRQSEMLAERGISCDKPMIECELGNVACTMYGAVWYGGACNSCGEFKQGNFVGNFAMAAVNEAGHVEHIPQDESLTRAIEVGVEIRSLT